MVNSTLDHVCGTRYACNLQKYENRSWHTIFAARRYASALLAMALCPSIRLSVCPSQVGVLSKRLNISSSRKQRRTTDRGF